MVEIVLSVKNQDEGTRWEFWKCLMNKTKKGNRLLLQNGENKSAEGAVAGFL